MDRIFKPPFSLIGALSPARQSCQSLFCLMLYPFLPDKNPILYRSDSAGERSGGARTGSFRESLARTGVSGAVGLRWQAVFGSSFGIDRLDARGYAEGRGSVGADGEDLDHHRRIFDGVDDAQNYICPNLVRIFCDKT